jgi:hypothetical protein
LVPTDAFEGPLGTSSVGSIRARDYRRKPRSDTGTGRRAACTWFFIFEGGSSRARPQRPARRRRRRQCRRPRRVRQPIRQCRPGWVRRPRTHARRPATRPIHRGRPTPRSRSQQAGGRRGPERGDGVVILCDVSDPVPALPPARLQSTADPRRPLRRAVLRPLPRRLLALLRPDRRARRDRRRARRERRHRRLRVPLVHRRRGAEPVRRPTGSPRGADRSPAGAAHRHAVGVAGCHRQLVGMLPEQVVTHGPTAAVRSPVLRRGATCDSRSSATGRRCDMPSKHERRSTVLRGYGSDHEAERERWQAIVEARRRALRSLPRADRPERAVGPRPHRRPQRLVRSQSRRLQPLSRRTQRRQRRTNATKQQIIRRWGQR